MSTLLVLSRPFLTLSLDLGFVPASKVSGTWTVDKVIATIPTGKPTEDSSSPLPYFHLLERLKTTKREGWRRFGIARYRNTAVARLLPDLGSVM